MSQAVAPCTQPLCIQMNAAAGLPALEQDAWTCVQMRCDQKSLVSFSLGFLFIYAENVEWCGKRSSKFSVWKSVRLGAAAFLSLHLSEAAG